MKEIAAKRKKSRRVLMLCLAAAAVLLIGCNTLGSCLASARGKSLPRNPETGILAGAEPIELGPEEADVGVLLVHGYIGGSNNFGELPERLAANGWRVRALRLPGHGTSPRELARTTVEELVDAVRDELAALRPRHDKVVLVGHSMGGALSTIVAAEGDVDALVLAAPYFGVTHRWYYGLKPEIWSRLLRPVVWWVYKGDHFMKVNRKDAKKEIFSYRWIPTRSAVMLVKLGKRVNAQDVLDKIECPVLLLHSAGDTAADPKAARRAFDAMASDNKRAIMLEKSDHHLFWDYERETVIDEIEQFIVDVRKRSGILRETKE